MLGLTLEGGGSRGAYQIGAWKAFRKLGIEFDGITGTSVGALNGALMIQGDFDLAYDLWYNMEPSKVLNLDGDVCDILCDDNLVSKELNLVYKHIMKVVKGFGLDTKPLECLVYEHLKEDVIRKSPKDFGIVTICLTDLKPLELHKEDIPLGKIADYLLASSCLPVFKSKKYDGKSFLDGGFYNNLPIDMLYKKGYRDVIAVRLNSQGRIKNCSYEDLNINYIKSHKDLGRAIDFSRDRARRNIQLGYFDTLRYFKDLKGKDYYITGDISEYKAFRYFMSLNEQTIKKLATILNLPHYMSLERALLEGIIPRLFELCDLNKMSCYSDLVFALLERMASIKNINPFEIYTVDMLVEMIEDRNIGKDRVIAKPKSKLYKSELFINKHLLVRNIVDIILQSEPYIQI